MHKRARGNVRERESARKGEREREEKGDRARGSERVCAQESSMVLIHLSIYYVVVSPQPLCDMHTMCGRYGVVWCSIHRESLRGACNVKGYTK